MNHGTRARRGALALAATLAASLSGCVTAPPATVTFQGRPVPTVSAASMSCSEPHKLEQDCSIWSGAALVVQPERLAVKVAGTADGRIVLVQTTVAVLPPQLLAEQAADAVLVFARAQGASLTKMEALAIGHHVPGYILHFDRDVYTALKAKAAP